jgi:hypothetical protein
MILKKHLDTVIGKKLVCNVIRTFSAITYPSAIIVLISGIYRVVQKGLEGAANSLWLNYMEMVGVIIVPLNIIVLIILGRRVTKLLSSKNTSVQTAVIELRLSTYLSAVFLIMLLILSVILIVSLRI